MPLEAASVIGSIAGIAGLTKAVTVPRGRMRDTVWLAAGPDLRPGAAVVVQRRDGTLLHVAPIGNASAPQADAD